MSNIGRRKYMVKEGGIFIEGGEYEVKEAGNGWVAVNFIGILGGNPFQLEHCQT